MITSRLYFLHLRCSPYMYDTPVNYTSGAYTLSRVLWSLPSSPVGLSHSHHRIYLIINIPHSSCIVFSFLVPSSTTNIPWNCLPNNLHSNRGQHLFGSESNLWQTLLSVLHCYFTRNDNCVTQPLLSLNLSLEYYFCFSPFFFISKASLLGSFSLPTSPCSIFLRYVFFSSRFIEM